MTIQVNITPTGRMSLPADLRKRLGLSDGGAVFLEETADGVVLRTAGQAVAHARAIAKRYTQSRNDEASVGRSGLLVHDNRLDFNDRGNIATGESGRGRQAKGQGEGSEFGHDHAPFSTLTAAVSGNIAATVA